ncbi:MAG: four helix bundle protein [Planctomycetes bacterium]|nr:four helix bundle protein [Planctomycetota bacterium]
MKRQGSDGESGTKGFEDLRAWQLAHRLMLECHKLADALPASERFDLVPQIRRSSKSTPANIAERYGRYHYLDSLRFYYIARGSLNETVNHIIAAHELGYAKDDIYQNLYELGREAERVLNGYIAFVWQQRQGHVTYGERSVAEDLSPYELSPSDSVREA